MTISPLSFVQSRQDAKEEKMIHATLAAFFISPTGELIWVEERHIRTVIRDPERFGLTGDEIAAVYKRHGERLGLEGNARKEILTSLIRKGWIRIRRYPDQCWVININGMQKGVRAMLCQSARHIHSGCQFKELDRYMPVKIVGDEDQEELTVEELTE